ncbi:hypothetical protein ACFYZ5_40570 [Streptomyces chartreusis]|uniref:hypothetical protein n=1 Tax=Streptomyces chartreusis TaxID=1969 RepID=UPI00368385FC
MDGRPELFVSATEENNSTGVLRILPGSSRGATAADSRMITAPSVGLTQQDSTLLGGNGLLGSVQGLDFASWRGSVSSAVLPSRQAVRLPALTQDWLRRDRSGRP